MAPAACARACVRCQTNLNAANPARCMRQNILSIPPRRGLWGAARPPTGRAPLPGAIQAPPGPFIPPPCSPGPCLHSPRASQSAVDRAARGRRARLSFEAATGRGEPRDPGTAAAAWRRWCAPYVRRPNQNPPRRGRDRRAGRSVSALGGARAHRRTTRAGRARASLIRAHVPSIGPPASQGGCIVSICNACAALAVPRRAKCTLPSAGLTILASQQRWLALG